MLGLPLDRVAAGVVALLIAYAAWNLLVNSMRVLLDASASPEVLERARALILAEPMVGEIRSLVGRNSGRYVFIETVITVRTGDLNKAHALSERIERAVKGGVPNVDRVLVHCEPEAKTQLRYAVPLADRAGRFSEDFGKSPYFALIDIDRASGAEVRHEVVANPYGELEKGRGIKVAGFLMTYKPDTVIARENLTGKGPGYALSDGGVEVRQTEARSLDELLNELTQVE
jgi:predicted Fe-Mo cluster-binding NifX family protein